MFFSTDTSQNHAIIDLLAGLEDDGFHRTPVRLDSKSQSYPGARSYQCNSDDEEAGPELDKEEAELSMIMSQQWDKEPPDSSASQRQVCFCVNQQKWLSGLKKGPVTVLFG